MKMHNISLKEINRLAIPAIIANIAEPLLSLVDTAVIGRLGTIELASVGIASSFFLLIIWTLAQTKSAISAIVSKSYGQQRLNQLTGFIVQAIFVNVLLGIIFYWLTTTFSEPIFLRYNAEGELLKTTIQYFEIRAIGFPLTLATFAIFGIFRGMQNTKWAMQISVIGALTNAILDFILVFGIEGYVKSFGVQGAAYASLIAQFCMFLLALIYLHKYSEVDWKKLFPIHPLLLPFLKMTTNLFIRTIALNIAYYLGMRYATGYGEHQVAAHTIAMNIWLFSSFLIDGYANAGNAISGKLFGAGAMKDLYKLGFKLLKINTLIACLLAVIYLGSYPIMGLFFTNSTATIEQFNHIFWLVILSQPINAMAFTFDGIFKGLGKTALLRNTLLLATFIAFVPILILSDSLALNLTGVWVAFLSWMIFRGGILLIYFKRHWRAP